MNRNLPLPCGARRSHAIRQYSPAAVSSQPASGFLSQNKTEESGGNGTSHRTHRPGTL